MNPKIDTIIFSFDRAMQLELLLESIEEHDIDKILNIIILYSYSNFNYQKAYTILRRKFPQFNWQEEEIYNPPKSNFDFDLLYWHNFYWWMKHNYLRRNRSDFKQKLVKILTESSDNLIMFLTDDCLFYRNIIIPKDCIQQILDTSGKTSFSLRHGANLKGGIYSSEKDVIHWNMYENDEKTDWGYPFSVDGHIYLKSAIVPILRKTIFTNPNTLEGNLCFYIKKKQLFPYVTANKESCLIGLELNRVQNVSPNNHLNLSSSILNEYFIRDYSLAIDFVSEKNFRFHPRIESVHVVKEDEKITLLNVY